MRNIIFILLFLSILSFSANGQDTLATCVKVAPLGLPWKIHIDVEQTLSKTISVGANVQYYYYLSFVVADALSDYNNLNAFKMDAYARVYFKRHAPTGWYVAPFVGYGSYIYTYIGNANELINANNHFKGGGLSFGNQSKMANSNYILDLSVAIQIYSRYAASSNAINYPYYGSWDMGGLSVFAPRLTVGLVF